MKKKTRKPARKTKTRAAKASALPPAHSEEWYFLVDQVEALRHAIDFSMPEAAPMIKAFGAVSEYEDDCKTLHGDVPNAAAHLKVIDAFHAQPQEARRRMLRGWEMERWPTRDNAAFDRTVQAMLTITINDAKGITTAAHQLKFEDSSAPMHVHVRIGVSQQDVLDGLDKARQLVATQWSALQVDPGSVNESPSPVVAPSTSMDETNSNDPAFLTQSELFELAVQYEVLQMRLEKYGTPDERYARAVHDAGYEVRDAITNEFLSSINFVAQSRFEEWEAARGTFGKHPRHLMHDLNPDGVDEKKPADADAT